MSRSSLPPDSVLPLANSYSIVILGRDLWVSAQMQTAHASGLRDDGAAHHEAGCLAFPADYLDTDAGSRESTRVREELELKHEKRPHNRRVRHWKKLSVKFPYSFEFPQLVSNWTGGEETKQVGRCLGSIIACPEATLNFYRKRHDTFVQKRSE